MPTSSLAERVRQGDVRALARAISLVEDDPSGAAALVGEVFRHTGRAWLLGITGPPGAGKSTLVDRLAGALRARGTTVGILAVDPSSPFSGGAILGDRVRMASHAADPGVFIRSMATRGHLGGLSRATADAALLLDAAGRDCIIVETVGVGQDEVEIAAVADVCVVVLAPGAGDEIQALKAGIMEIADIFAVNKADREGADRAVAAIEATLALQEAQPGAWAVPVLKTVAVRGEGIEALVDAIERFRAQAAGEISRRREARSAFHLRAALSTVFMQRVAATLPAGAFEALAGRVAAREIDPYAAARDVVTKVCGAGDTRA